MTTTATKTKTFRHSAGFGKRIEFWIIGRMLKEGLDVYVPLVGRRQLSWYACQGNCRQPALRALDEEPLEFLGRPAERPLN